MIVLAWTFHTELSLSLSSEGILSLKGAQIFACENVPLHGVFARHAVTTAVAVHTKAARPVATMDL